MRTDPTPITGTIKFGDAYKRTLATASEDQKRNLSALGARIARLYEVERPEDLEHVNALEVRTRLKTSMLDEGRNAGYIRNLLSTLNRVLRAADVLPDHSPEVAAWRSKLETNPDIFQGSKSEEISRQKRQLERAKGFFYLFIQMSGIGPDRFTMVEHFPLYRKFVGDKSGLSLSSVRKTARAMGTRLIALGYAPPVHQEKSEFPRNIELAIQTMGEYAVNSMPELLQEDGRPKLFAEIKGNQEPIREVTWKSTVANLRYYLSFWQKRELAIFENSTLATWLTVERVMEFFSESYEKDFYSAATGETWIVRLNRLYKYAVRTHVAGFENTTEADAKAFNDQIWPLVAYIRKRFRKSTVGQRMQSKGGLPSFEEIHKNYEVIITREARNLHKKLKKAKALEKTNPEEAQKLHLQVAIKVREILKISFHLYLACRPMDIRANIRADQLSELSPNVYHLYYLPKKTDGKRSPPAIDAPLPSWLGPLLKLYLTRLRELIYPGSTLLFPAELRAKIANATVAKPGEAKSSSSYEWLTQTSKKYFGRKLSANQFRYILTNFFDRHGLPKLYSFMGHVPTGRSGTLTEIEANNYLRQGTRDRITFADGHQKRLTEILVPSKGFIEELMGFKSRNEQR